MNKQHNWNPEMLILRRLLDDAGIEWVDRSEPGDQYSKCGMDDKHAMQRTHFMAPSGEHVSAIWGYGSYGYGTGCLEAYMPDASDPQGPLTAQEVFDAWVKPQEEVLLTCKNSTHKEWLESKAVANDGVAPLVRIPDALELVERIRTEGVGTCELVKLFERTVCSHCSRPMNPSLDLYCPSCGRKVVE